jgi:uncharacterized protein YlxW (UPF0749 family)
MATWIWIGIAVAAVIVLAALVVFGARRAKERRVVQQREKAQELRQEAEQRHRKAKERENLAQELSERAATERKEGDEAAAQAARVDPDRD